MRDAAVAFFHREAPNARVIHELNVGGCRADLAVVDSTRIFLVEIKSSKDTLSRLERQVKTFGKAAHETIVIADAKWWTKVERGYHVPVLEPHADLYPARYRDHHQLWHFPVFPQPYGQYEWSIPKLSIGQPHARPMLEMLWKQELLDAARKAGVVTKSRWAMRDIIDAMVWAMTGEALARAACAALRARPFAEADPAR